MPSEGTQYYTLTASLPKLPHPFRATRLPINRQRLESRFTMLRPPDAQILARLEAYFEWLRETEVINDLQFIERYRIFQQSRAYSLLAHFFDFRADMALLVAAIRRRQLGGSKPQPESWSMSPLIRQIIANWEDPEFKMAGRYPWVARAREMIEEQDAMGLESMRVDLFWRLLERLRQQREFSFVAILVYRIQWHTLNHWLLWKQQTERNRIDELVSEVISDNRQLIN